MASVNYQILSVDLAQLRTAPGQALLAPGIAYDGVTVLVLPAGAVCSLVFGDNKQEVPLTQEGASYTFLDQCGNPYSVDEALRFVNPLGAGIVQLLISFGSNNGNVQTAI